MSNPLIKLFQKQKPITYLMAHEEELSSTDYSEKEAVRLLKHYWTTGERARYFEFLSKLLSNNCYSERILNQGVEAYYYLTDYRNAYHLAKKLNYEFEKPGTALLKLGYLALINRDYRFAINWLEEYRENRKNSAEAVGYIAECSLRLGDFRQALALYEEAAPHDEVTRWLHHVCGRGLTRRKKNWHGRRIPRLKRLQAMTWRADVLGAKLQQQARNIREIDQMINSFQYVSDDRLFKTADYWQVPAEFENNRRGDCEDFALWVWVQLLRINIRARFVLGGMYSDELNHAWVHIYDKQGVQVLECTPRDFNRPIPARSAHEYIPLWSIDKSLLCYAHT